MRGLTPKVLWINLLLGTLLTACGGIGWRGASPMSPGYSDWGNAGYASNGEQVYFSATNQRGERIRYRGGPAFGGMMMGSSLSCASCHGSDGRGGTHFMHMQVMDAPDIRYTSLNSEADEHEMDHDYDLETFRRAVVEGQHPDGDALSGDMPRWKLSDSDLLDLFEYLKTLP